MAYHSVIVSEDLCGAGQVSLGVAIPILAALDLVPRVLPTALLSTNTAHAGNTYLDLSGQIAPILTHWRTLWDQLGVDGIYLGYLGPKALTVWQKQLPTLARVPIRLLDPAMADHGRLYRGLDEAYVAELRTLIPAATIITPNVTEAYLLLGQPPALVLTEPQARQLAEELADKFGVAVVVTGIPLMHHQLGVAVVSRRIPKTDLITTEAQPQAYSGAGDVFASVLVGALLHQQGLAAAAKVATAFMDAAFERTLNVEQGDVQPFFDIDYAPLLPGLMRRLHVEDE
ncbi:PfkB family carbohydrate kinase [Schleiferilactobacillus shenzhenensis]|uniref:Pyridoxine kinase n=1 Tax=Schleiferilactobacillus shenzhenensis LY-73 TaxID=1231336 RepID=U4THZ9_9LACO|nr:PfkB family carbohydrate kinase [Schleiferilactobacillus shenzhenensis]ERL63794.1 pyridoxine kinase [Schleiferilactobacillus shenzhenensis LY-73]